MDSIDIPSPIDFHNRQQTEEWIQSTLAKRPYRPEFFTAFANSINSFSNNQVNILEIGSGPGHLAKFILEHCTVQHYTLLDFSLPMHEIAKEHLTKFVDKAIFLQQDFKSPQWTQNLEKFDVIVTMQAAHEVRHKNHIAALFFQLYSTLNDGGMFLYSDHYYVPSSSSKKHPELYLKKEEQPELLRYCGFKNITLILDKSEMALYRADK
jgi:cyclopropane fatty-acyl-phospholipid synthase-like methyltransferase